MVLVLSLAAFAIAFTIAFAIAFVVAFALAFAFLGSGIADVDGVHRLLSKAIDPIQHLDSYLGSFRRLVDHEAAALIWPVGSRRVQYHNLFNLPIGAEDLVHLIFFNVLWQLCHKELPAIPHHLLIPAIETRSDCQ